MISLGALKDLSQQSFLDLITGPFNDLGDSYEFSTVGHHLPKSGSFFLTPLWVCDGGAHLTDLCFALGVLGALVVN